MRTWLLARYFSVKFSVLATICSSANVTVYYNATMLGVVSAFRKKGKPVWDVQHGYLGPSHDAYNNTAAFAIDSTLKPTGFIVWSNEFGRYVESTLGSNWRSTDYAHLKMFKTFVPPRVSGRTQVLFTLQTAIPVPPIVLKKATEASSTLNWVFRMHPFDKTCRPELSQLLISPNVSISDGKDPLALAIAGADIHVTVSSSVVHEAAALNVSSIFFDYKCCERFERESLRKLAFFTDEADFDDLLERLL
jgi:hypothetical protein